MHACLLHGMLGIVSRLHLHDMLDIVLIRHIVLITCFVMVDHVISESWTKVYALLFALQRLAW